jgi:hypothetical protein
MASKVPNRQLIDNRCRSGNAAAKPYDGENFSILWICKAMDYD